MFCYIKLCACAHALTNWIRIHAGWIEGPCLRTHLWLLNSAGVWTHDLLTFCISPLQKTICRWYTGWMDESVQAKWVGFHGSVGKRTVSCVFKSQHYHYAMITYVPVQDPNLQLRCILFQLVCWFCFLKHQANVQDYVYATYCNLLQYLSLNIWHSCLL